MSDETEDLLAPPTLETPKEISELVPSHMLGRKLDTSTVICVTCRRPLYVLYLDDLDKPPLALGDWEVPKSCDEPCPICHQMFAKFNDTLKCAQYLTSLGWM